jgi:hypothetical protein
MSAMRPSVLALLVAALACPSPAAAQQIGHKVLGSIGLLAGSQPDSGLYLIDLFAFYSTTEIFDKQGHRIPVQFDATAFSNPVGFQATFQLTPSLYPNVSAAAPSRASASRRTSRRSASMNSAWETSMYSL